ncbi:MAG: hypothetical protein HQK84_06155, partial [Nitrospinae bacterium]|nr:hypothetical protein [Nitrospinota bacterium]
MNLQAMNDTKNKISLKLFNHHLFWIFLLLISYFFIYSEVILKTQYIRHDALNFYGLYKYMIEGIQNAEIPFWDIYSLCGTPFYPSIPLIGLLDPLVFITAFTQKVFGQSSLDSYLTFYLLRAFIAVVGTYLFLYKLTGSKKSAFTGALLFFFAFLPSFHLQNGSINSFYLTPLALLFFLSILDRIKNKKNCYLSMLLFTFTCGVIVNVFIPTYFTFYFIVFLIALFFSCFYQFKEVFNYFNNKEKRGVLFVCCCLILLFLIP